MSPVFIKLLICAIIEPYMFGAICRPQGQICKKGGGAASIVFEPNNSTLVHVYWENNKIASKCQWLAS